MRNTILRLESNYIQHHLVAVWFLEGVHKPVLHSNILFYQFLLGGKGFGLPNSREGRLVDEEARRRPRLGKVYESITYVILSIELIRFESFLSNTSQIV